MKSDLGGIAGKIKRVIIKPERGNGQLRPAQSRGPIITQAGTAGPTAIEGDSGIAIRSLTEVAGTRELYDEEVSLTSSDGVFVIVGVKIKALDMETQAGDVIPVGFQP